MIESEKNFVIITCHYIFPPQFSMNIKPWFAHSKLIKFDHLELCMVLSSAPFEGFLVLIIFRNSKYDIDHKHFQNFSQNDYIVDMS